MQIVFQCLQSTVYVLNCHGALYTLTTKHHSHKHVNSAVSHPSTTQPRRRAQIRNDAARTPNTSSKSRVILRDRDCSFLGGLSLPPAPSPLTAGTPPPGCALPTSQICPSPATATSSFSLIVTHCVSILPYVRLFLFIPLFTVWWAWANEKWKRVKENKNVAGI